MFVFLPEQILEWGSLMDYTFIMPAVSVGNVGQLSVDLLISSLQPVKIAKLDHPVFVPVVGSDPYNQEGKGIMTAAELYISKEKKMVILQIRSLLVKEHCADFLNQLVEWIKVCAFSNTVLLSSCHSYERIDAQLTGSPFRYTVTSSVKPQTLEEFRNLQWTALEARRPVLAGEGAKETLFYPGGGFTSKLHNLCNANQIPFVTLLIFCSEGDNIPGVLLVANHLDRWMKLIPTTNNAPAWKFPISWKHFFGNPPPISMY